MPGGIQLAEKRTGPSQGVVDVEAAAGLAILEADRDQGGIGDGAWVLGALLVEARGPEGSEHDQRQAGCACDQGNPPILHGSILPLMKEAAEPLILVVDDDDAVRRSCVDLLEARGHRTAAAATVGEGLRLFDERKPAAVLLDLKLPDGAGLDVLRELQRRAPGTPVIVISGLGSVSEAVEAMRVGATDFVEKPVGRERLFEVLSRALAPSVSGPEADLERVADGRRYGMVGALRGHAARLPAHRDGRPHQVPRADLGGAGHRARSWSPGPSTRSRRAGTRPCSSSTARPSPRS